MCGGGGGGLLAGVGWGVIMMSVYLPGSSFFYREGTFMHKMLNCQLLILLSRTIFACQIVGEWPETSA